MSMPNFHLAFHTFFNWVFRWLYSLAFVGDKINNVSAGTSCEWVFNNLLAFYKGS